MKDIIANLRTAISFSQKPGNEGQCLANAKGSYRPVVEILDPVLKALENVQETIDNIKGHAKDQRVNTQLAVNLILNELSVFESQINNPNLQAANNAKRGLK